MPEVGILFLVVGPSGAGKDTLLAAAKARLREDPRYIFARRAITRPSDPDDEDHSSVTGEEFDRLAREGAFCLSWQAHGLKYGIPAAYERERQQGRHIIANVSRQIVTQACTSFSPVEIILVTAPKEILAERLAARRRESTSDIQTRLDRAALGIEEIAGASVIDNSGSIEESVTAFLQILEERSLVAAG